eukprot:15288889-Ditylum_brightwellii.AAC.1
MCNKDSKPSATANMKSISFKTNATSHFVGNVNGINNQDKSKQLALLRRYGVLFSDTHYKFGLYMGCPIIMSSGCTGKGELPPVGKGKSGR